HRICLLAGEVGDNCGTGPVKASIKLVGGLVQGGCGLQVRLSPSRGGDIGRSRRFDIRQSAAEVRAPQRARTAAAKPPRSPSPGPLTSASQLKTTDTSCGLR